MNPVYVGGRNFDALAFGICGAAIAVRRAHMQRLHASASGIADVPFSRGWRNTFALSQSARGEKRPLAPPQNEGLVV
jgi:hypothetical protein